MNRTYPSRFARFPQGMGAAVAPAPPGFPPTDETDPNAIRTSAINPGAQDPSTQAAEVQKPIWIDPPASWENIDQLAYVPLGAQGAGPVTILKFIVPGGRNGVINKIGNNFIGGGWVEGSGAVIWQILVDGAPPPGATSYASILGSLGSPAAPTAISGFRIFENQTITVVASNIGVILAGQSVGARLAGFLYPRELEDASTWI